MRTLGCEPFRPIPRPRVRAPAGDRLLAEPPSHAWESLDAIDLREEFFRRRRVLKACPRAFRGRFRHAQRIALEAIDAADRQADPIALERGWKLFGLLPTMLLHYPVGSHGVEPAPLETRFESFARDAW